MPHSLCYFSVSHQVRCYNLYAQAGQNINIVLDRLDMGPRVLLSEALRNRFAVQNHAVNDFALRMLVQGFHMLGSGKVDGFARLPHQIHEINLQGRGFLDGLRDAVHQQVRDHAGIKRAGTKSDQISLFNGFYRFRQRFAITWA